MRRLSVREGVRYYNFVVFCKTIEISKMRVFPPSVLISFPAKTNFYYGTNCKKNSHFRGFLQGAASEKIKKDEKALDKII